ncbi:hypothetical protein ILYODFUR_026715 [Ilyodon furcidens]|uniref:Uncharacterized protein n=1 Tax=Ilyodon furcidens TaxID=33524 RepID=A0ABV0T1K1_9TELE
MEISFAGKAALVTGAGKGHWRTSGSKDTEDLLWIAFDCCNKWYHQGCVMTPPMHEEYCVTRLKKLQ